MVVKILNEKRENEKKKKAWCEMYLIKRNERWMYLNYYKEVLVDYSDSQLDLVTFWD